MTAPTQAEKARKAIASDNPGVVILALKTLGTAGKLTDLPTLMGFTTNAHAKIKQAAIDATCILIKENLILHFNELDKAMRDRLGNLMQTLDPSVLDEIGKDLYHENDDRRLRAVQILGHMGKNPKIKEILAKLVQDRNVKIKATAAHLMSSVMGPQDQDQGLLHSLLNDEDIRVRANTIEALEIMGHKRLVPILLNLRRDPSNRIRGNVLKALFKLGYTEIDQDLFDMIKSSSNLMKASALWVVSQTRHASKELLDLCASQLLSSDNMVHRNSRNALEAINNSHAKGYLRYLADFLPRVNSAAAVPLQPAKA
ncbi:MAG: HEAT repeat domain-containing protein [Chitinispirillaceae bacterium]|jgi:HEAT repeat protein|nr:HEAT repeat domain-containing protein [Chitinispirillaceae bacterium]